MSCIGWRIRALLDEIEQVYYTKCGFDAEEIAFLRDNLTQYTKEIYAQESARWMEKDNNQGAC